MGNQSSTTEREASKDLSAADEGAPYFSATLRIGDNDDEVRPIMRIKELDEEDEGGAMPTLQSNHFVAVDGATFSIKCTLARAPAAGIAYGARVYVDSGDSASNRVFRMASGGSSRGDAQTDNAECDHFFWFGPGETTYVVRGFMAGANSSYQFRFGAPVKADALDDSCPSPPSTKPSSAKKRAEPGRPATSSIGCIRIQFAKVASWSKEQPTKAFLQPAKTDDGDGDGTKRRKTEAATAVEAEYERPSGATVSASSASDRKKAAVGHVAALPGECRADGLAPPPRTAKLGKGVLAEVTRQRVSSAMEPARVAWAPRS